MAEIISAQTNAGLAYHLVKLIMRNGPTWSMQKMGRAAICVAHSFRRNATMLTHCDVNLVLEFFESEF